MPYKDPEKKRWYDREYKRKQRAKEGLTRPPCQTRIRKCYVCLQAPNLRLPGAVFKGGLFVTDAPMIQAMIEADSAYGVDIFSWVLE